MDEKKTIKISLGTAICMFIIFILILALGGMWYYYNFIDKDSNLNKNELISSTQQNNVNDDLQVNKKEELKLDVNKELVYDAEYTDRDLEGKSYTSHTIEQTYSLKDIVLPYININSEDAANANKEIKKIFEESAEFFKQELEDSQVGYCISNYKTFTNNEILSIIITVESGGTDVETYEYYTYNFDLNTLKIIDFSNVYKKAGFSEDEIDSKVINTIKKCERFTEFSDEDCPEGTNVNTYINKSIDNYENSVLNNSIKYFIDANGKLNIIVTIEIPAGREKFDTILTIN